jgi:glutamine---fructose-6-phosphate transaminase (isomerizing)
MQTEGVGLTDQERKLIQGRYFADILGQPSALEATLDASSIPNGLEEIRERLQSGRLKRVVLTGMGASLFSLTPLGIALTNHGYETVSIETSELIHYQTALLNPESLLVVVSQSGRSAEIVRLLELNGGKATVLGVSNDPQSPLALTGDATVLTVAGDEFSVSCKTYLCTLAALETISGFFCGEREETVQEELRAVLPAVTNYVAGFQQHVQELAPHLVGIEHVFCVGRGASMAAARAGALINKESVRMHAEAMSSAALRHGPMELLEPNRFVAVLEGAPVTAGLNEKMVTDVRATGARAQLIGLHAELTAMRLPFVNSRVAPILEILPFQMVTLSFGYLAGREAGVFRYGGKVTATE